MKKGKFKWTDEAIQLLIDNWNKTATYKLAKEMGTTSENLSEKAKELGLPEYESKINYWTDEEERKLQELAPTTFYKEIAAILNKSEIAITKKAIKMGIKLIMKVDLTDMQLWTEEKEEYLLKNYDKIGITEIGNILGISYHHIIKKLEQHGIDWEKRPYWSDEEVEKLRELAPLLPVSEIAKELNRGKYSIIHKAKALGIDIVIEYRNFTAEEERFVSDNWDTMTANDIARILKCSRTQLDRLKKKLNLKDKGQNIKWDEENIDLLRKLAKTKTTDEIAKKFKTTNIAIHSVAHRNGISLIDTKVAWSKEDNETLRNLSKTMDLREISEEMNRSPGAIRAQATRENITLMNSKKHKIWTIEDDKLLIELAQERKTVIEIARIMSCSDETIIKKAKALNVGIVQEMDREWTEEESELFKEVAKTLKIKQLVATFNRPTSSIKKKAELLGITLQTEVKNWTDEEIKLLEKLVMIDKKTPKEVADILGRSEDAIIIKINREGLKIQTNNKKYWSKNEEQFVTDMWGIHSIDYIAKKLNRTVSSVKNKIFTLGLGGAIANNYDGLTVQEICDLLGRDRNTVSVNWPALGLKFTEKKISSHTSYRIVEISDLLEFLEQHQNQFDSRNLERNILGKEPEWLLEKRKKDILSPETIPSHISITKAQLIAYRKQLLALADQQTNGEITTEENPPYQITKRRKQNGKR